LIHHLSKTPLIIKKSYPKTHSQSSATMPLVVPGLMTSSSSNNKQEDWMNKLIGKKITDGASNEVVRIFIYG